MAALAASDVSYAIGAKDIKKMDNGEKMVKVTVSFGDGALTYPAGGVPLTSANMGLPNNLRVAEFSDMASANGLVYKMDLANKKIRIYQEAGAAGALAEFSGAIAATSIVMNVIGF